MPGGFAWTSGEIEKVKRFGAQCYIKGIEKQFGGKRTFRAIRHQAFLQGVRSEQWNRWTQEEYELLRENYKKVKRGQLAKLFPRHPYTSIVSTARKLGLQKHRMQYSRWNSTELKLVADLYPGGRKEDILKAIPKHTWLTISRKAQEMGIKRFWFLDRAKKTSYIPLLNELRRIRLRKRIQTKVLATALGVTYPHISAWETGRIIPKFLNVLNWCQALGVELSAREKDAS